MFYWPNLHIPRTVYILVIVSLQSFSTQLAVPATKKQKFALLKCNHKWSLNHSAPTKKFELDWGGGWCGSRYLNDLKRAKKILLKTWFKPEFQVQCSINWVVQPYIEGFFVEIYFSAGGGGGVRHQSDLHTVLPGVICQLEYIFFSWNPFPFAFWVTSQWNGFFGGGGGGFFWSVININNWELMRHTFTRWYWECKSRQLEGSLENSGVGPEFSESAWRQWCHEKH